MDMGEDVYIGSEAVCAFDDDREQQWGQSGTHENMVNNNNASVSTRDGWGGLSPWKCRRGDIQLADNSELEMFLETNDDTESSSSAALKNLISSDETKDLIMLYGEEQDGQSMLLHKDAMTHVLDVAHHQLGLPVLAVVDLQNNMVYLRTVSGMYMSSRPRLLSFFDWVMNLHHNMTFSDKSQHCSVVKDLLQHPVLGFGQYVLGPPRIRSVIGHPVVAPCHGPKDDSFIGFFYGMDRVSCVQDVTCGYMGSFSRVIGGILVKGGRLDQQKDISSRKSRLEQAFCHSPIPLMIVKKTDPNEGSIEICNHAFTSYFDLGLIKGFKETVSFDRLGDIRPKNKAQAAHTLRIEALFKKGNDSCTIPIEERVLSELCMSLILNSSFGLDGSNGALTNEYYLVYTQMKDGAPVPQNPMEKGTSSIQDLFEMRDGGIFECNYGGKQASLETFRCRDVSMARSGAEVIDSIMSLHHTNILGSIHSGASYDTKGKTKEFWILQETSTLGRLHELILSGGFSTTFLKPLIVALSALDIARGIQELHNRSLIHGSLSTRNIYVQIEPDDAFRGWRLVLGIPNVFDNVCLLNPHHEDINVYRSGREISTCPERVFGGKACLRTDSYAFGMILWEMWECSDAWPQIYDEVQLVDKFTFENDTISKYRYGMPEPLSTIFTQCIGQTGYASPITNETIIALLEDFIKRFQETIRDKNYTL